MVFIRSFRGPKLMMDKFVLDLAAQMGIHKLRISVTDGTRLGCRDMHLVNYASGSKLVGGLIHQSELEHLQKGIINHKMEIQIRSALTRLKLLLDSQS